MAITLSAFVLGYSGTIGSAIVKALAQEPRFDRVVLIGRREIELPESDTQFNYTKFEQKIVEDLDLFIKNPENSSYFTGIEVGFYALGISSNKVTEDEYRKIEHDYCIGIAKLAQVGGCEHFHYISGKGAKDTGFFLYAKVKAQVEQELELLKFSRLSVYRPGMTLIKYKISILGQLSFYFNVHLYKNVFNCIMYL